MVWPMEGTTPTRGLMGNTQEQCSTHLDNNTRLGNNTHQVVNTHLLNTRLASTHLILVLNRDYSSWMDFV